MVMCTIFKLGRSLPIASQYLFVCLYVDTIVIKLQYLYINYFFKASILNIIQNRSDGFLRILYVETRNPHRKVIHDVISVKNQIVFLPKRTVAHL